MSHHRRRRLSGEAMILVAVMAVRQVQNILQPFLVTVRPVLTQDEIKKLSIIRRLHDQLLKGDYEATVGDVERLFAAADLLTHMGFQMSKSPPRSFARDAEKMFQTKPGTRNGWVPHDPSGSPGARYRKLMGLVISGRV